MPRERLGVALVLAPPVAVEVDGLRRALGDGALGRIPAHLTLVPPVNVPVDRVPDAVAVLREAAAGQAGPLRLRLGPPATFHPVTPVVHLPVGGDTAALHGLRDRVFVPPLERSLTHPFVPHVTVADDVAPDRIPSALAALADYRVTVAFDRVHLLRERRAGDGRRIWRPIADAGFRPAATLARGGLPLEVTVSEEPGPDVAHLATIRPGLGRPFAVVARRDGEVVGVALGATRDGEAPARLDTVLVVEPERRQGIGRHLLAAVETLLREREASSALAVAPDTEPAAALLDSTGWRRVAEAGPGWSLWRTR